MTNLDFAQPEWFSLLPLAALTAWIWCRRLLKPLRILIVTLLVCALARPSWDTSSRGLDLWVLVDRSDSASPTIGVQAREWEQLLQRSRGRDDRLHFIDFADGAALRRDPDARPELNGQSSRLGLAMESALGRCATDRANRLLLFTDGQFTDGLGDLTERCVRQGIPVDLRLGLRRVSGDLSVHSLRAPGSVTPGELFLVEARVRAELPDGEHPALLECDGREVWKGDLHLRDGEALLRLQDAIAESGCHRYELRLTGPPDPNPGNDKAQCYIDVRGGPRSLVISSYLNDPLAKTLADLGQEVRLVTDPSQLQPSDLSGVRLVCLNDIPAWKMPAPFLRAFDFYVRNEGGGLLMTGGRLSFGSGGYFESPIDKLLPVSMELKSDIRKLSCAISIVLDRSGSMACTVPDGRTKIELADDGAARTVTLLSPMDTISVYAVDSSAHEIVNPVRIGGSSAEIQRRIRSIQSEGGGIYVYEGLSAAWRSIRGTPGSKHIILFSDAADSEEPGAYKLLLQEVRAAGGTVSVIAMGSESDPDAALLKDIAKLGGGRIFFSDKAEDIPAIFAQETVSVARSAFLKGPLPVKADPLTWAKIAAQASPWLEKIGGYNLSYLRPESSCALLTQDEYKAPLVSWCERGAGRVGAIGFPIAGECASEQLAWAQYGDFLRTFVRYLAAPDLPPGASITHRLEGSRLVVKLHHDAAWAERFAQQGLPALALTEMQGQSVTQLNWRKLSPGEYEAQLDLTPGQTVRGAATVGRHAVLFGPVQAPPSEEWQIESAKTRELQALVQASRGRELADLSQAWLRPPLRLARSLVTPLVALALALFVLEFFLHHTGLSLLRRNSPQQAPALSQRERSILEQASIRTNTPPVPSAPAPASSATDPAASADDAAHRRKRYEQARLK